MYLESPEVVQSHFLLVPELLVARVTTKHVMDLVNRVKYELVCITGDGKPGLCTLPCPTNTLQDTGPGEGERRRGREEVRRKEREGGSEEGGEEGRK